jgi:hypothetical protein
MRVILQRNLFINGVRYRRDRRGTELPDEMTQVLANGDHLTRKVEMWKPDSKDETKQDPDQLKAGQANKVIVLPRDARVWEGKEDAPRSSDLLQNAGKDREVALNELRKGERDARGSKPQQPPIAPARNITPNPSAKNVVKDEE